VLAALPVYWLLLRTDKRRLGFLLLGSVAVLGILHPIFIAIAIAVVVGAWSLVSAHAEERVSVKWVLFASIAVGILVIAVGKYGGQLADAVWSPDDWIVRRLVMPLGISYFVFRLLQYVFDCIRGTVTDLSVFRLATFIFFVPTFPAGPLETYQGFYEKRSTSFDRPLFYAGCYRIALGYFKKVVVVDYLMALLFSDVFTRMDGAELSDIWRHPSWGLAYVVLAFLRAYLDLSAYTDLAIGFSSLFGFRIMENFHRPLIQPNLAEFWRNWHISLSSWVRNNVYFPLFGVTRKAWLGLYAAMLTMGLWHYVDLNWTMWGLYHGTGLVLVARWMKLKRKWTKKWRKEGKPLWAKLLFPLGYVLTFLYVALGYAFVATDGIVQAFKVYFWALAGPFVWLAERLF